MSDGQEESDAIIDAAKAIVAETTRINTKLSEIEEHVHKRKEAVRRLAALTDVTVDLMPATMSVVAYEDIMLLEIYKAGTAGTTRYHLKQIWKSRFGREGAPSALDDTLKSLVDQGRVVDRGGTWAILHVETPLSATGAAGSMKERVIRILEAGTSGIRLQSISDELARLYGTDVPVTVISPLLSRMKRAGLVVHEGHRWRLIGPVKRGDS
jgi:hypothetical protein